MSAPATNALPLPAMTMPRTAGSAAAAWKRGLELRDDGFVQRVHGVRPIDGQRGDAIGDLGTHEREAERLGRLPAWFSIEAGRAHSSARQTRRRGRGRARGRDDSSARTGRARQRRPTRAPMSMSSIVPTPSSTSAPATKQAAAARRSPTVANAAVSGVPSMAHCAPASTWARRSAGDSYIGPNARPSVVAA